MATKSNPVTKVSPTGAALKIKCHGIFYYRTEHQRGEKQFNLELWAPSLSFFEETFTRMSGTDENGKITYQSKKSLNVRGILKKLLLPKLLSKSNPDFVRVKKIYIDRILAADGSEIPDLPVNLQSVDQLKALIKRKDMPIDADTYIEVDDLRTDVNEYLLSPEEFIRQIPLRSKKREEQNKFLEMNDLVSEVAPATVKSITSIAQGNSVSGGNIGQNTNI